MRSLLLLFLLRLGQMECAKSRSVNLALETVFEFNNESDLAFVDTVQDFLNKVKFTLEESYRRNDVQSRRLNTLKFTDFIEDTINIIRSYNDLDLSYFIELLSTEINSSNYEECEITVKKGFGLRRYLSDRLSKARDKPASEIRQNLNDILRELKNKSDRKGRILYSFLNSIVKRNSQAKFKRILDNLQLYRRRQMDPTMNLRKLVQDSIGSMITDYICNLNYTNRQKLKNILELFTIGTLKPEADKLQVKNKNIRLQKKGNKNKAIHGEFDGEIKKKTKKLQEDSYHVSVEKVSARDSLKERDRQQKYKNNEGVNDYENKNNILSNIMNSYKNNGKESFKSFKKLRSKVKPFPKYFVGKKTKGLEKDNVKNSKSIEKTKNKKTKETLDTNTESLEETENSSFDLKESKEKYGRSDDSISVSYNNKKTTKKPKSETDTKRLKTFVTLYPEEIQFYVKSNYTHRNRKTTTSIVRKRFTVKSNNEDHFVVTNNTKRDDGMEKKLETIDDIGDKRFKIKANLLTIKHRQSKKTTKIQSNLDSKENLISASSKNEEPIEHFGSLYHKNNKKYSDVFYHISNGYRKSNALNIVTTPKDDEENTDPTPTHTTNMIGTNKNSEIDTFITKTTNKFGTLAFWGGTKKTTIQDASNVPRTITVNLTEETSTQTNEIEVTVNNTKTVTRSNSNVTSEILFRSRVSNISNENKNFMNDTKFEKSNNVTEFKNDTIAPFIVTNTNNYTKATEKYKEVDLRRLLDSSVIINEIQDESKKKEIGDRFKEDLKKIFLPTVSSIGTNSSKDPIEEIEDVFNIS